MGYWNLSSPSTFQDVLLIPPTTDGTTEGETTTTTAVSSDGTITKVATWSWTFGTHFNQASGLFQPCLCSWCTLYESNFNCLNGVLPDFWSVSGSYEIVENELPYLAPITGTIPSGQSKWEWSETTKHWTCLGDSRRIRTWTSLGTYPLSAGCYPSPPDVIGTTDGEIAYTNVETTTSLLLSAGTTAMLDYGSEENTLNNFFVAVEVLDPVDGDEAKIFFDGGSQYAYFKFGASGAIGINSTTRNINLPAMVNVSGNGLRNTFLCLWVHAGETGGQVATALVGAAGPYGGLLSGSIYYPFTFVKAVPITQITSGQIGIGCGTNAGTMAFDQFEISRAPSKWSHRSFSTPDPDCFYYVSGTKIYPDACGVAGTSSTFDCISCVDGIMPESVTISLSGCSGWWRWYGIHSPWSGGANYKTYSSLTDPGNPPPVDPGYDYQIFWLYKGLSNASSLDGSYILDRSGPTQWQYYGSCSAGDFVLTLNGGFTTATLTFQAIENDVLFPAIGDPHSPLVIYGGTQLYQSTADRIDCLTDYYTGTDGYTLAAKNGHISYRCSFAYAVYYEVNAGCITTGWGREDSGPDFVEDTITNCIAASNNSNFRFVITGVS